MNFLEYILKKYGLENVILTGEIECTKTMHSILRRLQEMDGEMGFSRFAKKMQFIKI